MPSARKKVQAREEGKIHASQHHLSPQEGCEQPREIYQVQIMSTNPTAFHDEASDTEHKGGALDDMHFAFGTISHSFLITKLLRYRLDEWIKQ